MEEKQTVKQMIWNYVARQTETRGCRVVVFDKRPVPAKTSMGKVGRWRDPAK